MAEETWVKTLECACGNKGVAVYSGTGTNRKLHDVAGDFRKGDGSDPAIFCTVCGREVQA